MTRDEWGGLWSRLCRRFNREPEPDLGLEYLRMLEQQLETDGQIRRGVSRVFYADRYFPSPKRIVEAATGGSVPEAEWRRVLQLGRSQQRKEAYPKDEMPRPSDRALEALDSIGGVEAVKAPGSDSVRHLRSAFLDAYEKLGPPLDAPPLLRKGDGGDGGPEALEAGP